MTKQINLSFDKVGGETLEYVREIAKLENRSVSAQIRHILAVWAREHQDKHGPVFFTVTGSSPAYLSAYRIDSHGFENEIDHDYQKQFPDPGQAYNYAAQRGWSQGQIS